ncbi:type IV pilus biogenesis protein PilP [Burkholderia cenocepacia]|uniref:type IV pilus biogenesis protein PilP n=1 Tax=Burkholderia cenocepacia TaxID=95486 RepID=UPI00222EAFB3|nr:type IV pilus biogenesis protein PilP [Burkholderia cenocepacia]MCW3677833.1 type IV pilus biogenesis protein PilP [Burkholderia cenocepacia]
MSNNIKSVRVTSCLALAISLIAVSVSAFGAGSATAVSSSSVGAAAPASPEATKIGSQAAADTIETPTTTLYSQLQAEKAILKERKEIAVLKKEIREIDTPGMPAGPVPLGFGPAGANRPVEQLAPAPKEDGIIALGYGSFEGRLRATVSVGGQTQEVAVGDQLPGGWTVSAVTQANVKLKRKGAVKTLGYQS